MKMNTHRKIFTTLLLTLMIFAAKAQQRSQSVGDPVNIILFIADDLGIDDTGPYGNTVVRTPYIDQLSEESFLFTHAFASSPNL